MLIGWMLLVCLIKKKVAIQQDNNRETPLNELEFKLKY